MIKNMKTQFADHLCQIGFISSNNPKNEDANYNSSKNISTLFFPETCFFFFFFLNVFFEKSFLKLTSQWLFVFIENQVLIKAVLCAGFYPNVISVSHFPNQRGLVFLMKPHLIVTSWLFKRIQTKRLALAIKLGPRHVGSGHRNIRHRMRAPISCQSKNCRHKMADL